ncbi:MAG TPA: FAD-binding protein [Candidatus Ratteibacteria bacterium]|nr:FAD-binding protein [Candidatus Ratteibacteria bacterium]
MIKIIYEKCNLCKNCIESCPFGAIEIKENKININEKCTLCGLCIKNCPEQALYKEEKEIKIDTSDYKGIWFFAETREKGISSVSYEMLSACLKLKEKLNEEISGVLLGGDVSSFASQLIERGCDNVYIVENEKLQTFKEQTFADAFSKLIKKYKPSIVIAAATMIGRSFIPFTAARIKTGLTADCTDIDIDEETGLLVQTRPTFGGNLMARIICKNHRPQMATIRPKIFSPAEVIDGKEGKIIKENIEIDIEENVEVIGRERVENVVDLQEAEIIISGGRGIKAAENFSLIRELAGLLGAAVGSSRAAVDSGWIPYPHQVGQTGKTVKPKIYIACGISGAIQHLAGMQTSDYIIAINKDPDAPIFKVANLGIVGDVFEILPLLIKKLKQIKGG